MSCKDDYNQLH